MSRAASGPVLHLVRRALHEHHTRECDDAELLQRFVRQRDESAFEAILCRHGPMVFDVCRSLVPSEADAEDAFQAVFLVLARKAGSIRQGGTLAGWLHGVACRTARKARAAFARRRKHETRAAVGEAAVAQPSTWDEVQQILHEELARLADRYRLPLVVCYLQSRTQDQAAVLLGLSKGTLRRRLDAGRALLRARLRRRGVGPAAVLLAAAGPAVGPAVPPALLRATAQIGTGANLSAQVMALAREATPTVLATPLRWLLAVLALGLVGAGLAWSLGRGGFPPAGGQGTSALPAVREKGPAPQRKEVARTDRHGDPLPPLALARLGTQRFRSDSWISQVAVVPGTRQLLGLGARAVILWDADGREVRRFHGPAWRKVNGGGYGVRIEAFAVSPDGKLLAAGTSDGSRLPCPILLFDLASGKKLGELPGHRGAGWSACRCLAFVTPALLVSSGADNRTCVWDVAGRREARQLQTPGEMFISSLVPVRDGKHVFGTGGHGEKGLWLLWDVTTGKVVHRQTGLPGQFVSAALSPDDRLLAVSVGAGKAQQKGGYNEVRLYSAPDWKQKRAWRTHAGEFPQRNAVAFSPDGKRLATGGADQKARQWDVETGREAAPAIEPYRYANRVAFLDADTLLTFDSQHVVKFWNARTGKPKVAAGGAEAHLTALAWSPDGRHVVTGGGGGDATLRVWEVGSGKQVAHLRSGLSDVTCVQFSPDGKWIACADSGGMARVWDWARRRQLQALGEQAPWLYAVAFSPDGKLLATGDGAGVVRVWDLARGKVARTLQGHEAHVTALVWARDGRTLFSGSWDHSIRRWDLAGGKTTLVIKGVPSLTGGQKPVGHTNVVTGLALSPGGRYLYSGSYDHLICAWEADTGRLCRVLKGPNRGYSSVEAIALSRDGTRLAAAIGDEGQESSVHLWDVPGGKKVATLPGHRGKVTRLAFSPDGTRLASCSTDTTVLLWSVAGLGARPAVDRKALPGLWDDLGSADPASAYDAVCRGAAGGERTVAELAPKLKPLAPIDEARFAALLRQLDSDQRDERERASGALAGLGLASEALLRKAAGAARSAEVRVRLRRILDGLAADLRRSSRAVEVLEMIGTRQARRLLAELARGADGTLTREAAAALKRLEGQAR